MPCSMWDLSCPTGIEPEPPALKVQNLNHWTTREVLLLLHFKVISFL